MMNRRDFIEGLGVLGVIAALPFKPQILFAADRPGLPVSSLLRPGPDGRINLKIMEGQSRWGQAATQTWGINGPLLGPSLALQRGQKVSLRVENGLAETTTLHWHGLEIPGVSDGGPQIMIQPGGVWTPELTVDQRAATCWYHPHPHAKTGRHVAMGLGGLLLLEDEESRSLALPSRWGVDDIPVIIQDKRLNAAGQIDYTMDVVNAAVGWFGDLALTNGVPYPQHTPPRGWLRLRLLNACNARYLRLARSDKRPMYVIAGDGGFLPEPVSLTELTVYMGERFEVLLDCTDGKDFDLVMLPSTQMGMALPPFDRPVPVLRVQPLDQPGHKKLPDKLLPLPALPDLAGVPVRKFQLTMDPRLDREGMMELMRRYGDKAMSGMDMNHGGGHGGMSMSGGMAGGHGGKGMSGGHGGMSMGGGTGGAGHGGMNHGGMAAQSDGPLDLWTANRINGRAFAMNTASFEVKRGVYERWIISGVGDKMLHPFHVHGTQFRILSENGAEPEAHRKGLKDTVHVEDGISEILVRFLHPAPPERMYMAHCHLLEHEDTGMMLSFTVS